ncbi:MAG: beta-glucosidase, partial [Algoriella sp.]
MLKNYKKAVVACTILCSASAFAQTKQENKLLDKVQKQSIQYFWDYAEPHSKLARERFHPDGFYQENDSNIITTGGTGFGLMSLIVGIDRKFIPRKEAVNRILIGLQFLEKADRFHGAWPHWLDGETGKVKAFSTYDNGGDLVETAFLAQGLICLKEYFKDSKNEKEIEISQLADRLWKGIDFNFYTRGED